MARFPFTVRAGGRRVALPCAVALVVLLTSPVAAAPAPPAAVPSAPLAAVEIRLFGYEPGALEVAAGTTVVWTNYDSIIHSVTSGTPDAPDGAFDSDFFDQDTTFALTFADPGQYAYFCRRHTFMRGQITVLPADG